MRLQHRRSKRPQVPSERIKWWKLTEHNAELETVVKTAIRTASAGYVKKKWSVLEQAIKEGARDILGTTKSGRPFIDKQAWWWSEEVQVLVKKKKDAYKKWLKTRSDDSLREYREAKAEAKKAVATAKLQKHDIKPCMRSWIPPMGRRRSTVLLKRDNALLKTLDT
ncbi:hypothetical protein Y032_0019g3778 [Ancylostoma ceylanicum]|nr:hypothetical protein Y032_0019g3778 [Ancylostoma ceylanicum]